MPKVTSADLNKRRPSVSEWGMEESRGYLDSLAFKLYCDLVETVVYALHKRNKRPVTVAEIRRGLGERLIDEQLWDALDAKMGEGSIEMTSEISPIKFAPKDIPVKKVWAHNQTITLNRPKKDWVRYTK